MNGGRSNGHSDDRDERDDDEREREEELRDRMRAAARILNPDR